MYPRCRQEAEVAFLISTDLELVTPRCCEQAERVAGGHGEGSPWSQDKTFVKQSSSRNPSPTRLAIVALSVTPGLDMRREKLSGAPRIYY